MTPFAAIGQAAAPALPLDAVEEPPMVGEQPEPEPHPLDKYWATLGGEELCSAIYGERDEWVRVVRDIGLASVWSLANAALYSQSPEMPGVFDTIQIGIEGQQQLRVRVDEPATLCRKQVTMATGQRAAFLAVARTADAAAFAMAPTIDSGVDYFYRREMPDSKERALVTSANGLACGYVWWRWDKWAGDEVEVDSEQVPIPDDPAGATAPMPIYGPKGAPVALVLNPWDEFHNVWQRGRQLWRGVQERRNKYELMALCGDSPEGLDAAEKISGMTGTSSEIEDIVFGTSVGQSDDDLVVIHWYHVPIGDPRDPGNKLRRGRQVSLVGNVILPGTDGPLMVSRRSGLPIVEMMPEMLPRFSLGYTPWWNTLAAQQGKDAVISDMMTNVAQFGRISAFKDAETDLDMDRLVQGGGVFTLGANERPPGFMQPAAMSQAAPYCVDYFNKAQQSVTALNDTALGQPGANVSSGEFAALLTNVAVEFNSPLQIAVDEVRRHSANILIDLLLLNAEDDMMVQLTGLNGRPYIAKFRRDLLKGIQTIEMQTVPPMMRSAAGRMQMWNMIKDVEPDKRGEAIMLLTTGQWRQMTETESASFIRIRWENEQLAEGKPCSVSATDDPYKHLPQHVRAFNELSQDPEGNAAAIKMQLQHIQEHLSTYYTIDPMMCAMLKFQPPPDPNAGKAPAVKGALPTKPGEGGHALPNGSSEPQPKERFGSALPNPSKPPAGAPGPVSG